MLPREVQTIAPTRVPVTVPPPEVLVTVTPPSVTKPRSPMITQEDPIEDSRQMDTVEHNNQNQLKHRYPTRITQLSQDINQVDISATTVTIQQNWLTNIHEQLKATPKVIENCLKDNAIRKPRKTIQPNYLTKMANAIIDDETRKELNYCQLSKHTKNQKI